MSKVGRVLEGSDLFLLVQVQEVLSLSLFTIALTGEVWFVEVLAAATGGLEGWGTGGWSDGSAIFTFQCFILGNFLLTATGGGVYVLGAILCCFFVKL